MIKNLWTKFVNRIAPMQEAEASTLDMMDSVGTKVVHAGHDNWIVPADWEPSR